MQIESRNLMRKATLSLTALAGLTMLGHGTAHATQYPYCMTYNEGWSGAIERCDYSTMEQCQASTPGLNGYCSANWRLAWNQSRNPAVAEPDAPRKKHIRQ